VGAVYFSIDTQLISELKRHLPLEVLVETGTFEGDTVAQVRELFETVYTVELSEKYFEISRQRFLHDPAVYVSQGHSPDWLKELTPRLKDLPVLYWLDAHWCVAEQTAGEISQCPLMEELKAIGCLNSQSVLMIDDAHLFLCPPPQPHESSQWPPFDGLIRQLRTLSPRHQMMVLNDVFLLYPDRVANIVQAYARENSVNWLTVLDKSRDYDQVVRENKEKEVEIHEKEAEIRGLQDVCNSRLELINQQHDQILQLRQSAEYRLGYSLLNPWQIIKNKLTRLV
jgi:hypothetical protein